MAQGITVESAPRDGATRDFLRYAQEGDLAILEDLLGAHAGGVYRQAQRFLGHATDADDAVQEAYLQLVRSAKRFDGSIPFGSWLGRLVHLACLRVIRSRRRHRRKSSEMTPLLPAPAEPQDDPEQAEALRQAVARLPERYRAPICLHYFGQLDLKTIALAMGVSANVVAVRLHRAREALRQGLHRSSPHLTNLGLASALSAMPGLPMSQVVGASVGKLIGILASGSPLPATAIKLGIIQQGILTMSSHPYLTTLFAGMVLTGVAIPIALHAQEESSIPAIIHTNMLPAHPTIPLDHWQSPDGSWDDGYGGPPGTIAYPNRGVTTAFALLDYVGAGFDQVTPNPHQHAIAKGIAWLLQAQKADGSFGGTTWEDAAQTVALTEIYSISNDAQLKEPCQRAVAALLRRRVKVGRQVPLMAWPEADGRVSTRTNVLCIIALKSATAAQMEQVAQPLVDARAWLDEVWSSTNSKWLDPKTGISTFPAMVDFAVDPPIASGSDAASALAIAAFVKEPKVGLLSISLRNALVAQKLPPDHAFDYTTVWLQSLGLSQVLNTEEWQTWREVVDRRLINLQQDSGPLSQGWKAVPDQGSPALGNVTSTAIALLTEEIIMRYDLMQKRRTSEY